MELSSTWLKAAIAGAGLGAGAAVAVMKAFGPSSLPDRGEIGAPIGSLQSEGSGTELPIYLDWNATTPIFPEVKAAMDPFTFQHFGNPSSNSPFSVHCGEAIKTARESVAEMLGAASDEIIFMSCGTECDNSAIHLAVGSAYIAGTRPHIVTTNIEHPAIEECLAVMEELGKIEVTRVPAGKDGVVPAHAIISAIREATVLVTVMHSNNEIGSINPIPKVAAECRRRGVLCHTDAAQSCGKVKINVDSLGVDMLTCVGHKFGAPKGVAALYVRKGCLEGVGRIPPPRYGASGGFLLGGGQECGRRAGTENVLQISALGRACAVVVAELDRTTRHMIVLRDRLLTKLQSDPEVPSIVNGPKAAGCRLPNTLSISFKAVDSGTLLAAIRGKVAASAGSACHTGGGISAVLEAIEVPSEYIKGTLRLSVGRHTTNNDVDRAAEIILTEVRKQLHILKARGGVLL